MKKIITLTAFVVLLFTYTVRAQAPRTMLYEQSTSADCVNCPYANQVVDPVLLSNFKKVVALKYQAPQPGGDVMYWQNPTEVDARQRFYDFFACPVAVVDGDTDKTYHDPHAYNGYPGLVTDSFVILEDTFRTPIAMRATYAYDSIADSIHTTIIIKNVGTSPFNASGAGRLHLMVAIQEMDIHFVSPPASNGEEDFYYVFRKFYPDTLGTVLPNSLPAGDSLIYTLSIQPPSYIYRKDLMALAIFIQDFGTSKVAQAVRDAPFQTPVDIQMRDTTVYPSFSYLCAETFTPKLMIKNLTGTVLTSAVIGYYYPNLNRPAVTYQWTGSLDSGQSTIVTFPTCTVPDNTYDSVYYFMTALNSNTVVDMNQANNSPFSPLQRFVSAGVFADTLVESFDEMSDGLVGQPSPVHSFFSANGRGFGFITDQNHVRSFAEEHFYMPTLSDSSSSCGGFGLSDASYYFALSGSYPGVTESLTFDKLDRTAYTSGNMTFEHAYAVADTPSTAFDTMRVLASLDCGQTWDTLQRKNSAELATAPPYSTSGYATIFLPDSSQWARDTVDMSAYNGKTDVIVQFQVTHHNGNGLYIDNINWTGINPSGIRNAPTITASVYPNPAHDQLNVRVNNYKPGYAIEIHDMTGRLVMRKSLTGTLSSFAVSYLTDGMYLYRIVDDSGDEVASSKLSIEK